MKTVSKKFIKLLKDFEKKNVKPSGNNNTTSGQKDEQRPVK